MLANISKGLKGWGWDPPPLLVLLEAAAAVAVVLPPDVAFEVDVEFPVLPRAVAVEVVALVESFVVVLAPVRAVMLKAWPACPNILPTNPDTIVLRLGTCWLACGIGCPLALILA